MRSCQVGGIAQILSARTHAHTRTHTHVQKPLICSRGHCEEILRLAIIVFRFAV